MPKDNHVAILDYLRGAAALAVVGFHFFYRGQIPGWMPQHDTPLLTTLSSFGYLGVHLFFMISGFVILMTASNSNARQFAASRTARLIPAMWVCVTLTALVEWLVTASPFKASIFEYVVNLTMLQDVFGVDSVDGAYWSLGVEIRFYAAIAIILTLGRLGSIEPILIAWLVLSTLNYLRPMYRLEFWLNVHWAPLFAAGATSYLIWHKGQTRTRLAIYAASFGLALLYALTQRGKASPAEMVVTEKIVTAFLVATFFAVFLAIACGKLKVAKTSVGLFLGAITYPLYLLHQNIGYAIFNSAPGKWAVNAIGVVPFVVLLVAVFLAVAWLIHWQVERPLGRLLRTSLLGSLLDKPNTRERNPA